MKLLELYGGIKALQKLSPDELVKELTRRGFFKKELGRGQRGVAFELPDGNVLKAWAGDPGYDAWIDYAKKHPNPFFIKVLSPVKSFKSGDHEIKYVKLEKLEKRSGVFDTYLIDSKLVNICGYLNDEKYPPFMSAEEMWKKMNVKPTKKWLDFTNAIIQLAEQLLGDGFELDLNKHNIGKRQGSDLPVILDALYANSQHFGQELVDIDKVLKGSDEAV